MTSQKQIAANRRNAQKSTGPRTDEGKAASSRNALKHGVLSTKAVSERENKEAYEELLEQLIDEFEPDSAYESILVERLAISFWRERRLAEAEANEITRTHVGADILPDYCATPCRELSLKDQLQIGRYQSMLGRHSRETVKELLNEQNRRMQTIEQDGKPSLHNADNPAPTVRQRSRPH